MTDQEFYQAHKDKSEDDLRAMAWRHGYGKGSSHYVNKRNNGQQGVVEGGGQQAAIAIAKRESGKYTKDGKRKK
jgi:hypothetical protein